jgi:protein TonB
VPTENVHLIDVVLGVRPPERHGRLLIAAAVALGFHGALWCWAQRSAWLPAGPPTRVAEPSRDWYIDIDPTPPPPREPPAEKPQVKPPPARVAAEPLARPEPASPAPPAQAGAIVAQEPDPSAAVDFTDQPFVTGTANAYAGGLTAATGTNPIAVPTSDIDPHAAPGPQLAAPDLSTRVSLQDDSWSCPWPSDAETAQIDEQTVTIRVVVEPDGSVASTEIISDPGHGFGPAAATCAVQTHFTPAHDRKGAPVRAKSPPIRVRFTR